MSACLVECRCEYAVLYRSYCLRTASGALVHSFADRHRERGRGRPITRVCMLPTHLDAFFKVVSRSVRFSERRVVRYLCHSDCVCPSSPVEQVPSGWPGTWSIVIMCWCGVPFSRPLYGVSVSLAQAGLLNDSTATLPCRSSLRK